MAENENSARDTHFQGFAKLLYDELGTLDTWAIQRFNDYTSFDILAKKLIAQRAYDLASHVIGSLSSYIYDTTTGDDFFVWIPDLKEWPGTSEQSDTSPPH